MSHKGDMMTDFWNRPCATKGLTSYRYRSTFGWVMIGATDDTDALNEANRSIKPDIADLPFRPVVVCWIIGDDD